MFIIQTHAISRECELHPFYDQLSRSNGDCNVVLLILCIRKTEPRKETNHYKNANIAFMHVICFFFVSRIMVDDLWSSSTYNIIQHRNLLNRFNTFMDGKSFG